MAEQSESVPKLEDTILLDNKSPFDSTESTTTISKKQIIILGVGVLVIVIICAIAIPLSNKKYSGSPEEVAKEVLSTVPLIDGHNDLARSIKVSFNLSVESIDLRQNLSQAFIKSHTDIPRLRAGMVGAQFWSCFAPCNTQYKDAVRASLDQLDVIHRLIEQYSDAFEFVTTSDGIHEAFKKGLIASLIGLEGGHSIDSSLGTLRQFYRLGARYMTLTHNCNTPWVDCNLEDEEGQSPELQTGLAPFGQKVVLEMNRLGMLVDLSHVSKKTMVDTLLVSKAPIIFSHSSAWAVCNHPRNVQDDVLKLTAENGGIVMVDFNGPYINCPPNYVDDVKATLEQVADHIDHIRSVAGINHVGIGADYNGIMQAPNGLKSVEDYPALFTELARRGWTGPELEKLASTNFVRVFKAVEEVRDTLAAEHTLPHEDIISPLHLQDIECRTDL